MSDETKAGIIAVSWLTVFAVFCVEPSVIKALLLIFTTVTELLYIKHDHEKEQLSKRARHNRERASVILHRELEKLANEPLNSEEKYKTIIGEWK